MILSLTGFLCGLHEQCLGLTNAEMFLKSQNDIFLPYRWTLYDTSWDSFSPFLFNQA